MNKLLVKRIGFTILLLLTAPLIWAQTETAKSSSSIDQALRSHDKIYVVMTICILILVVLFLYLIRIDSKISKKEKSF